MSDYRNLLKTVKQNLENAGNDNATFEARELVGAVIGCDCRSGGFEKALDGQVTGENAVKLLKLCEKRAGGEPLQYLIGEWEFYGLPFKVGEGVLVPRQDTETLVETAVGKFSDRENVTVVDLCAGTGCVGIALEKNISCGRLYSVEKSPSAVKYLVENVKLNDSEAEIVVGDVLNPSLAERIETADLIVCNPPYLTREDMKNLQQEVQFEPETALFGGEDGLDFYRGIVMGWKNRLKSGGVMMFEIGMNQEQEVMQIMIQHGFKNVRAKKDLCGIYRVVSGEMSQIQ